MFATIVDSGESDHLLNNDKIVTLQDSISVLMKKNEKYIKLQDNMGTFKKPKELKTIVTAGIEGVIATKTDAVWRCVFDQAGQRVPRSIFCHART